MIRLHVPSIWGLELDVEKTTITDESLLYLQYIQAIYNIITGIIVLIIYHDFVLYNL